MNMLALNMFSISFFLGFMIMRVCCEEVTSYVSHLRGTGLNVILSSPHGGKLKPDEFPVRDAGCWNETDESCIWRHECEELDTTR